MLLQYLTMMMLCLHGICLTELCLTKRADLQAASDGDADGPLIMQQMDETLPVTEEKMSQVMADFFHDWQSFIHLLHFQGTMQSS